MLKVLKKIKGRSRSLSITLIEDSPLRKADPRTKLILSISASLAVMLPLYKVLVFFSLYLILIIWARLLKSAARQIWKIKWLLLILFIADWIFISLDLAIIITLRLSLLTVAFSMFFSTTTPNELCLALEWMRIPYRYAFSISLAFSSITVLNHEWKSIIEAQRSRGALVLNEGIKKLIETVRNLISLTVPSIVLTTRRAWSMTEAAYARGFDSPKRIPYKELSMSFFDWFLIIAVIILITTIILWRH